MTPSFRRLDLTFTCRRIGAKMRKRQNPFFNEFSAGSSRRLGTHEPEYWVKLEKSFYFRQNKTGCRQSAEMILRQKFDGCRRKMETGPDTTSFPIPSWGNQDGLR